MNLDKQLQFLRDLSCSPTGLNAEMKSRSAYMSFAIVAFSLLQFAQHSYMQIRWFQQRVKERWICNILNDDDVVPYKGNAARLDGILYRSIVFSHKRMMAEKTNTSSHVRNKTKNNCCSI